MRIQKKTFLLGLGLYATGVCAQQIRFSNTIAIDSTDTKEMIIEKAAHVVPTANQMKALQKEFIAFIHWGPNTFTGKEWGSGFEDPKIFNPSGLDTDQWCEAMKEAGMRLVLLTVKHHDGYVLWQTRYTKHGVMSSPFQNGKSDVFASLAASCKKYGLKLGVYLSPADLYQIEQPDGLYGNGSKYSWRTIPREVPGRPFKCQERFRFFVDDYNEYFLNQLYELLTEYGPIEEVWFDGAHPKHKGGQQYNYKAWQELIHKLAPHAVIFGKEDIRWCGNEAGKTRDTEWNVVPYQENPDTMNYFPDMTGADLGSRDRLYSARYLHYQQAETNTSIREGWFYRADGLQQVRSADDVMDIYERSVGGNSTFLLNIPPNKEGRFDDKDVAVLKEVGKRIRETYGQSLLAGAQGPAALLDQDAASAVTVAHEGDVLEFQLPEPRRINRWVIQEAIDQCGERVEAHQLEAWVDGDWKVVAQGTNIGYKRILRFPDVVSDRFRLRITKFRMAPKIAAVSAHYYKARPPKVQIQRQAEGLVVLSPEKSGYSWKAHGEDVSGNLSGAVQIYYQTAGSDQAMRYEKPFDYQGGELKVWAEQNGERGAVTEMYMGMPVRGWTVSGCDSELQGHEASKAFDGRTATYWKSADTKGPHYIEIDLQQETTFGGWAYTPPQNDLTAMLEYGKVLVSKDGKKWKELGTFEFGNLINDPTRRIHLLSRKAKARFVRIESLRIAGGHQAMSIGEWELLP